MAYDPEYHRQYRAKNQERIRAVRRKWAKENPQQRRTWAAKNKEKIKAYELKGLYGISTDEHGALLDKQGGHCAFCDRTDAGVAGRRLHVDHDHKTGRVRGLLCHRHNSLLGLAEDDVGVLRKAIAYLEASKCDS